MASGVTSTFPLVEPYPLQASPLMPSTPQQHPPKRTRWVVVCLTAEIDERIPKTLEQLDR